MCWPSWAASIAILSTFEKTFLALRTSHMYAGVANEVSDITPPLRRTASLLNLFTLRFFSNLTAVSVPHNVGRGLSYRHTKEMIPQVLQKAWDDIEESNVEACTSSFLRRLDAVTEAMGPYKNTMVR